MTKKWTRSRRTVRCLSTHEKNSQIAILLTTSAWNAIEGAQKEALRRAISRSSSRVSSLTASLEIHMALSNPKTYSARFTKETPLSASRSPIRNPSMTWNKIKTHSLCKANSALSNKAGSSTKPKDGILTT